MRQLLKKHSKTKLAVGDNVRISKHRRTFDKGYLPQWTEEVFKVDTTLKKPTKPLLKVSDENKDPIVGSFYPEELQKVKITNNTVYRIEKILKTRRGKNQTEYLVKWLGYPPSFNSWINSKDLLK